ncbi:hypothetical protein [Escherichia coli]
MEWLVKKSCCDKQDNRHVLKPERSPHNFPKA